MKAKNNAGRAVALLFAALASVGAHAAQTKNVRDGAAVEAIIAESEPTRIRVEGAKITDVFGNIYSSSCAPKADQASPVAAVTQGPAPVNPQGEFVLGCDVEKGEIFISPVPRAGKPNEQRKPINLFVSTDKATYTLRLHRSALPSDTIVLVDTSTRGAGAGPKAAKSSQHVRSLKEMLAVMAGARHADDVTVESAAQEVALWKETRFQLVRLFRGRGMVGEEYRLTNVSGAPIVLAEQEFARPGGEVLAVAIDNLNLQPNESTAVFVIRAGE